MKHETFCVLAQFNRLDSVSTMTILAIQCSLAFRLKTFDERVNRADGNL